jgi:chitin synthase
MGDDLNVVPETFKKAADAQNAQLVHTGIPLQPPDRLDGRFAAAERLPGGWYEQANDSMGSLAAGVLLPGGIGRTNPHESRESLDSNISAQTSNNSIYTPRRVESIMGEEDRKKYAMAQASQRAAGGAYMKSPAQGGQVYEMSNAELQKGGWKESVESFASTHDRPVYQRAESYHSNASGDVSPDLPSPTEPAGGALTVPQASASGNRNNGRNGRSPLARASLIRTASIEGLNIELEDQSQHPQSPDHSPPRLGTPGGRS